MKALGILIILFAFAFPAKAWPEEMDCLTCHGELSQGKSVHPALLSGGCPSCHVGIDAAEVPHKITTQLPRGLSAEGGELCYNCHDKAKFVASSVHAPVGVGMCTSCHNPHRSDNDKLLIASLDTLCFNCHDKEKLTAKKSSHDPVKKGQCTSCHAVHVSNNEHLILKKGNILCRKCHPNVEKGSHAVTGFKASGHPLRGKEDPRRKGKTFECLSCHAPHSSDWGKLFRYKAETQFDLCIYCHDL